MTWLFELTPAVASNPGMPVINLEKEFGRTRVNNTGIDEMWMAGATLGAGLVGTTAVTFIPYQGSQVPFEMIQNHAGKLRYMSGGDADDAGGVHHRNLGPEPPGLAGSIPIMNATATMPISPALRSSFHRRPMT